MTVIATFGYPGAGKGTFTTIAAAQGHETIAIGDVVRQAAHEAHSIDIEGATEVETLDNDIVGQYATAMRAVHGKAVMALLTLEQIQARQRTGDLLVIDGVRSIAEIEVFEQHLDERIASVFIDAPFPCRLNWLRDRKRDESETGMTEQDLRRRDAREEQWGLEELLEEDHADFTIKNSRSRASFQHRTVSTISKILEDTELETQ